MNQLDANPGPSSQIQFCRHIHYEPRIAWAPWEFAGGLFCLFFVTVLTLIFAPMPLPHIIPYRWIGGLAYLGGIVAIIVFGIRWTYRRQERLSRLAAASEATKATEDARIRCVGMNSDFAEFGPMIDQPFEPAIFNGSFGSKWTRVQAGPAAMLGLVFGAASLFFQYKFLSSIFVTSWQYSLLIASTLSWILVAVFWPNYLRVIPGRLEILSFSPFHVGPRQFRSFDLTQMKVTVDITRGIALIGPTNRPEFGISLSMVPRGRELAYFLLLGAISTATPAPLPENELLG